MTNVKVICWKLPKIYLYNVAEFYVRLYGGGGGGGGGVGGGGGGLGQLRALPLPYKRLQNFETLQSNIFALVGGIIFKLGKLL